MDILIEKNSKLIAKKDFFLKEKEIIIFGEKYFEIYHDTSETQISKDEEFILESILTTPPSDEHCKKHPNWYPFYKDCLKLKSTKAEKIIAIKFETNVEEFFEIRESSSNI